jgi:cytochrome oxidase Cu insertion factor (SCO1/SenC/PrrC family)
VREMNRAMRPSLKLFVRQGLCLVFMLAVLTPLAAQPAQMQEDRVQVGDEAIDFTMQSLDGETVSLSDMRGEKNVVVIFFRGTW